MPQPASAIDGASMVTRLAGEVSVITAGRTQRVSAPVEVDQGSVVRTGAGGRAILHYADGSEVLLSENTVLRIEDLERRGVRRHIAARLDVGRTVHRVAKGAGAAGGYEVRTADAVAAVRGTTFVVACTADSCDVDVEEGVVGVTATRAHEHLAGAEVRLYQGQTVHTGSTGVGPRRVKATGALVDVVTPAPAAPAHPAPAAAAPPAHKHDEGSGTAAHGAEHASGQPGADRKEGSAPHEMKDGGSAEHGHDPARRTPVTTKPGTTKPGTTPLTSGRRRDHSPQPAPNPSPRHDKAPERTPPPAAPPAPSAPAPAPAQQRDAAPSTTKGPDPTVDRPRQSPATPSSTGEQASAPPAPTPAPSQAAPSQSKAGTSPDKK